MNKKWRCKMDRSNNTSIKLSEGFNLDEFTISQVAERHGYNNEPNEKEIDNLTNLCSNVLQPLREIIHVPIVITSGFRSFDVNTIVGGASNSQHLEGKAADFIVPSMILADVFNIVQNQLPFDQLIYEFGKWIHVSWNGQKNRHQAMISKVVSGKTVYENVTSNA